MVELLETAFRYKDIHVNNVNDWYYFSERLSNSCHVWVGTLSIFFFIISDTH